MPRVSKKEAQRRRAVGLALEARAQKRQKLDLDSGAPEDDGWQSDAPSEGMLTEEEDQYPIGQPKAGWEEAERTLHGYSKTKEYQQKTSYHKHKEDIKRRRDEKKALSAGIPVGQRAKPIWGDIRTMLPAESNLSTSEGASTPSLQAFSTSEPSSPSDFVAPTSPTFPASEGSLVRPYTPPNFEEAFLARQSFKTEANDLKLWLKGQKGKVTGDWLVRVQCLNDLLQMQLRNTSKEQGARRMDWIKYSEALARRVKRSTRWASYLRQWERDWFETRSPPPCPRRGRHVKRKSLFFDEGVVLAVREYLNVAMWHASPKGVCEAVSEYLQSERSAVQMMGIDEVPCDGQENSKAISTKTACRWLGRMGWVYGRNKKGYCDGHERPDVVEYREKVFSPRMKVSCEVLVFNACYN
jgi:hypothetical protein